MSIVCETYQFRPEEFARAVAPYITALKENERDECRLLSKSVVDLFESDPKVEKISLEFGSWDTVEVRKAVAEDLLSQRYIGWMLSLLLYGEFLNVKSDIIGGYNKTTMLGQYLQTIGWTEYETSLLIRGRDFTEFARKYIYLNEGPETIPDYWNHVYPMSTAAEEGWLDTPDVKKLATKLIEDEKKLSSTGIPAIADFNLEWALKSYQDTKRAYLKALEAGCGLCIICSG